MTKKLMAAAIVSLSLSACAIKYVAPDGRVASDREVKECQYEASKATAGRGAFTAPTIFGLANNRAHDDKHLVAQCLDLKGGYKPAF